MPSIPMDADTLYTQWCGHKTYGQIPRRTLMAMAQYLINGVETGCFSRAAIENNLVESMIRADDSNIKAIFAIASLLYNEFPMSARGNPKAYADWIACGGLRGVFAQAIDTDGEN